MAVDYCCKCKDCEYIDPTEKNGYKWYCTYRRTYEDPDEIKECRYYKERGSGSGGCFLTTVCCEEKGLPDDCYELTMMRKYRDEVLKKTEQGRKIIDFYYEQAPRIVKQIKKSDKKKEICEWIYNEIYKVVKQFEKGCLNEAGNRYLLMMYQADLLSLNLKTMI
ncbi:CFI-box-CTERM domain-containing protein [Mordavella massiliensis]|uniref:Uncharacterized protein n=1 Tax=Mordavella massiliensis TaxID=1871024 RepID=A0A939B9Q1_9CLOT|nr:CFI-box-CTERM domain-containing protein [Mordavella massiliensis]MBM6825938.1 hypothetical protein [Mordavella massiliensis]